MPRLAHNLGRRRLSANSQGRASRRYWKSLRSPAHVAPQAWITIAVIDAGRAERAESREKTKVSALRKSLILLCTSKQFSQINA